MHAAACMFKLVFFLEADFGFPKMSEVVVWMTYDDHIQQAPNPQQMPPSPEETFS